MRRRIHPILLLCILPFFVATESPKDPCDPETLIKACEEELHPYTYSNSRTILTQEGASNEIPVTLMEGEQYRLVFNMEQLPDDAVIRVYDGPAKDKRRDLLQSSQDVPKSRSLFVYDPIDQGGQDIYISYEIPSREEQSCFAFVVGYKLSFADE